MSTLDDTAGHGGHGPGVLHGMSLVGNHPGDAVGGGLALNDLQAWAGDLRASAVTLASIASAGSAGEQATPVGQPGVEKIASEVTASARGRPIKLVMFTMRPPGSVPVTASVWP